MAKTNKTKRQTIPAKEVGAEVVEKAIQDNPDLSKDFVEEALKATEEVNNGETTPYVSPSEEITDDLGEGATLVLPEEENVPIVNTETTNATDEPTELEINLEHTNINDLVKDILYISYLGGEIPFSVYTYLRGVYPFRAKLTLPAEAREAWENRSKEVVHERSYTVTLQMADANLFARKLVELGKLGAVLDGGVTTVGLMQCKLKLFTPVASEPPIVNIGLDKFKYTREELHMMDYVNLKSLGRWYGVNASAKANLINLILSKQVEVFGK